MKPQNPQQNKTLYNELCKIVSVNNPLSVEIFDLSESVSTFTKKSTANGFIENIAPCIIFPHVSSLNKPILYPHCDSVDLEEVTYWC